MRRAVILTLCVVVGCFSGIWSGPAAAVTTFPAAGAWSMHGADPANTYDNAAETTITPANVPRLAPAWVDPGIGGATNQLVTDGGSLFVNTGQVITALDAGTGQKRWTAARIRGPISSIVAYGGLLYAADESYPVHRASGDVAVPAIVAFDERTGALKWVSPDLAGQGYGIDVPLAVGGGRVYAAFGNGAATAVDAATGKRVWFDSENNYHIFASGFAYSAGHLVATVGARGGGTYASSIDPKNGRVESQSVRSDRAPTIVGDRIVAESADGVAAAAVNGCGAFTCPAQWQNHDFDNDVTNVAASARYVVVGRSGDNQHPALSVLGIRTGREAWNVPSGPAWAQVTIAGHLIYATSRVGGATTAAVYPLDGCGKSTCGPLWTARLGLTCAGCAPPVVSHGTLYLSEENNQGTQLAALRPPVATAYGPAFARLGSTVVIDGTAPPGATVTVAFGQRNSPGYVQRRVIKAGPTGVWSTTYRPIDDYRYYARAAGTTSPRVLTRITPTITGPARVGAGHKVRITGTDRPHARLHIWFRQRNSSGYVALRTVTASSKGRWSTSYVAHGDDRYYATDLATGQRSAAVLTRIG